MFLVIDDQEEFRENLEAILSPHGEVFLAEDGLSAWEIAKSKKFQIIITDYKMPHLDGISLIHAIRDKENPNQDTPIILLSGFLGQEEFSLDSVSNVQFARKPFKLTQLQRLIRIASNGTIDPGSKGDMAS